MSLNATDTPKKSSAFLNKVMSTVTNTVISIDKPVKTDVDAGKIDIDNDSFVLHPKPLCSLHLTCQNGNALLNFIKKIVKEQQDIYKKAFIELDTKDVNTVCKTVSDAAKIKAENLKKYVEITPPIPCEYGHATNKFIGKSNTNAKIISVNVVEKYIQVELPPIDAQGNIDTKSNKKSDIKKVEINNICIGDGDFARHTFKCERNRANQEGGYVVQSKKMHSNRDKTGGANDANVSETSYDICE